MNSSGNDKEEDSQDVFCSQKLKKYFFCSKQLRKNFKNFQNLNLGFPFLCNLGWDLVGGPTNGDTLGEAVISV